MSLVSVIIAAYNCEKYLQKCLDSIAGQSYTDLEILVCDDGSHDGTWELLSLYQDSRIQRFRNEKNEGVIYTRNHLMRKARGKYIIIQDADDWSATERIELLVNEFNKDEELGACGTAHIRIDGNGKSQQHADGQSRYITLMNIIPLPFMPASVMVHRKVYEELGGYHPYFQGLFAEDLYWIIRISEKYKILYLSEYLYYYRYNPDSITNRIQTPRQLLVMDLMTLLVSQRSKGTDWVEQGNFQEIDNFAKEKLANRKWISEKYRVVAAIQRDGNRRWYAFKAILAALRHNPTGIKNYITLRYVLFF